MEQTRIVAPTRDPRRVRAEDGTLLTPPIGWELLPPGDAGLTRRVKEAGPTWTVTEMRGRKKFSQGVWAPAAHIASAREALTEERATESYAKRRTADVQRRERAQSEYVVDFTQEVLEFLAFSPTFQQRAEQLAAAVAAHATPVGSGTVARTKRIEIDERAEAAVIAWLRHQTTAYDHMSIARVKGMRRQVRQDLARVSRALLDRHRKDEPHPQSMCPLCRVLGRDPQAAASSRPATETNDSTRNP